jgi:hypothetical protein
MDDIKNLPVNTRVMAPIGDVLYRGIIAVPRADEPQRDGTICVKLAPPVNTMKPYDTIDYITCPTDRVTLGWFDA